MNALGGLLLLLVGLGAAALGARLLLRRARESRWGSLVAIDAGAPLALVSARYRLTGRPDAVRRRPDGSLLPVERKSAPLPRGGPYRSHLVQLWAYCLLLEEATGRAPPFAVLRYRDADLRVAWDAEARSELLAVRRAVGVPYDGRATPSVGRCAACRWAARCDARVRA